jgi:phosphoribosyl 1,2-cyclic phosphate phosphodiesterase
LPRRLTLLGTGTSTGIPVIGCRCPVCTSPDPRNRRMRPGVLLELPAGTIVFDTSPDFRDQALRFGIERVDAVLYTHAHADHVFGLDDLRVYNFRQRASIPCLGSPRTLERLRAIFAYAFEESQEGGGKPKVDLVPVEGPVELLGERIVPVPVKHGEMEVYGWRIGDFALVTDVNEIPAASFGLLAGVRTLVLSALRYTPHPTHYNLEEAVEVARRIGARRTLLTHIAHEVDHAELRVELPEGIELAHDGLVVELD